MGPTWLVDLNGRGNNLANEITGISACNTLVGDHGDVLDYTVTLTDGTALPELSFNADARPFPAGRQSMPSISMW